MQEVTQISQDRPRSRLSEFREWRSKTDIRMRLAPRFSRLAMRGGFHTPHHLVEIGAAKVTAVHDDRGNLLRVGNIFERIRGKKHKVREHSFFDRSGLVSYSEKMRGIDRRRLQCFERSKSRGYESLQFLVQAEPRE